MDKILKSYLLLILLQFPMQTRILFDHEHSISCLITLAAREKLTLETRFKISYLSRGGAFMQIKTDHKRKAPGPATRYQSATQFLQNFNFAGFITHTLKMLNFMIEVIVLYCIVLKG